MKRKEKRNTLLSILCSLSLVLPAQNFLGVFAEEGEAKSSSLYDVTYNEDQTSAQITLHPTEKEGAILSSISFEEGVLEDTTHPYTYTVDHNGSYTFTVHYETAAQEPVAEESPMAEESPAAEEVPVVEETPVVEESPAVEEVLPTSEEPIDSMEPEVSEEPTLAETVLSYFITPVHAEESVIEETIVVEVTDIAEEPGIMPMSNEYTITYELGSEGTFAANGSSSISYSFDAGNTKNLSQIGYPIGTISGAAGAFSTSGSVNSSSAALLYYFDQNGNAVKPNYVPTSDMTITAYWVKDSSGNGVPDGIQKQVVLQSSNGQPFASTPNLLPSKDVSGQSVNTMNTSQAASGILTINITGMALVDTNLSNMHMNQFLRNASITQEATRANPAYAMLGDEAQLIRSYIECDKSLASVIDALPTATSADAITSWQLDANTLTAAEVMASNTGSTLDTFVARSANSFTVTYNLGSDGTFADSSAQKSVTGSTGTAYSALGYTFGTPTTTAGAYSSSGDILSDHALVLYWMDESGNLIMPSDTLTRDITLTALWISDTDGSGIADQVEQTYLLESDANGKYASAPVPASTSGKTISTISTYTDASGDPAYKVLGNFLPYQGYTNATYNQVLAYLPLRTNGTYMGPMKTKIAQVVAAMTMDKPLSLAIQSIPNKTPDTGYDFDAMDVLGTSMSDSEALAYIPTSNSVTYTATFVLPPQCTVTYHTGSEGTFADGTTEKVVTDACSKTYLDTGWTVGTAVTTAGAFATTGTILSSDHALLYWVDDQGQLLTPTSTLTDDTDLYAYWVKDEDGDGFIDGLTQSYYLHTNSHGTLDAPTSAQEGGVDLSTITSGTDAAGYTTYTIDSNYLPIKGLTNTRYTQIMNYLPLRGSVYYADTMCNFLQDIVEVIEMEKPLSLAITTTPTYTEDTDYVFDSWEVEGSPMDESNAMTFIPTTSLPTYQIKFQSIYMPTPIPLPSEPTVAEVNPGRSCQDDGYPVGYSWNGSICIAPIEPAPANVVNNPVPVNPAFEAPQAPEQIEVSAVSGSNGATGENGNSATENGFAFAPAYGNESQTWALTNFICAALSVICGVILLFTKTRKEEEEGEDTNVYLRKPIYKIFGILIAAITVIGFLLTENMRLDMVLADQNTWWMLLLVLGTGVVTVLGMRWKKNEEEKQAA